MNYIRKFGAFHRGVKKFARGVHRYNQRGAYQKYYTTPYRVSRKMLQQNNITLQWSQAITLNIPDTLNHKTYTYDILRNFSDLTQQFSTWKGLYDEVKLNSVKCTIVLQQAHALSLLDAVQPLRITTAWDRNGCASGTFNILNYSDFKQSTVMPNALVNNPKHVESISASGVLEKSIFIPTESISSIVPTQTSQDLYFDPVLIVDISSAPTVSVGNGMNYYMTYLWELNLTFKGVRFLSTVTP